MVLRDGKTVEFSVSSYMGSDKLAWLKRKSAT